MNERSAPEIPAFPVTTGADAAPRRLRYIVRFREGVRQCSAVAAGAALRRGDVVMVRREHGLEPARIGGVLFTLAGTEDRPDAEPLEILRPATAEEIEQYERLPGLEREALAFCQARVEELGLAMNLVRVERFFDGSKIIFYFTAESRVDFRELVKILVRQYHTRIELRQIGVRHETQMLGGLGACGRELCCSTFLNAFDSVSIKMAKAQDLPLNPTKISGNCNRLLCCLTYEYDFYRDAKRQMPRHGRMLFFDGETWQVSQLHPLTGRITVTGPEGRRKQLAEAEWRAILAEQDAGVEERSGAQPDGQNAGETAAPPTPHGRRHRRKPHNPV